MIRRSSHPERKNVSTEEENEEVKILPEAFGLLTTLGLWKPTNWKSPSAGTFYGYYTYFTFGVLIFLLMTQIAATLFSTKSLEDFTEVTYMLLSTFNASVKGATVLLKRRHVLGLLSLLKHDPSVPKNEVERGICNRFNLISRYVTLICLFLAELCVSLLAISPLIFRDKDSGYVLPLKAWHPFDTSSGLQFWLSYLHQAFGLLLIAAYDVGNDGLITGFMNQACAQLELSAVRLSQATWASAVAMKEQMPEDWIRAQEKKAIRRYVRHHLLFYKLTDGINSTFAPVISVQFCLSSIVICITVYQLSTNKSSLVEMCFLIFYLTGMLVEFFIYCWFANEVTVKSSDFSTMFLDINWTAIHVKTLKELLIIMMRSTSPVAVSCGPLITLSLTSYSGILKVSYSAFNVLQQSE